MSSFIGLLGSVAFSFVLQRAGKAVDFWLGERKITEFKKQRNMEAYWLVFASQSWISLYQQAALLAERTLADIFGERPLSFKSAFRFGFFAITLNFLLALGPLVSSSGGWRTVSYSMLKLWFGLMVAFVLINSILDFLAYLLTRFILRNPLGTYFMMCVSLIAIVAVSWVAMTISLVFGSALTTMPMLSDPLSMEVLSTVVWPLVQGWFPAQFLKPFDSNVTMQGVNMGYMALGAMPSLFVLLSILFFMLLLKVAADKFRFVLCKFFGLVLDDKKSFYEHVGFLASLLLIFIYWILWLLTSLIY